MKRKLVVEHEIDSGPAACWACKEAGTFWLRSWCRLFRTRLRWYRGTDFDLVLLRCQQCLDAEQARRDD